MKIKVTREAKKQILLLQKEQYLKVDLVKSGCCSYTFIFCNGRPKENDVIVESSDGIKIPVSHEAHQFLKHMVIDYKRGGLKERFFKSSSISPKGL